MKTETTKENAPRRRSLASCSPDLRVRPRTIAATGRKAWAVEIWDGQWWRTAKAKADGNIPACKLIYPTKREAEACVRWVRKNPDAAFGANTPAEPPPVGSGGSSEPDTKP